MTTRSRLLIGGAPLLTTVGAGLSTVNFALDDSKVNAYAMKGEIRAIVVKSDNGHVDLVPGDAGVRVRETQHFVSRKPKLDRTLDEGVLTLDSHCGSVVLRCYADLRVTVPAGVAVTVDADSGDVRATWISVRAAHVHSDSGDVRLQLAGSQSRVWAHTDSGDVEVNVPRGDYAVDADTDSGEVDVDGVARNDHAKKSIRARSDSGDVTIRAR